MPGKKLMTLSAIVTALVTAVPAFAAEATSETFKEAAEPAFAAYQRQIVANAQKLAAVLSASGLRLVSGGTDNHLLVVDVFSKGITGKLAEAGKGKSQLTLRIQSLGAGSVPLLVPLRPGEQVVSPSF